MSSLTLNFSACSDRGLVRGNNEDSAYAGPRLLALADGMGGHAAGEVASQFLINALRPLDSPLLDEPDMQERLTTLLATAMDEGNQSIAMHVDENPQLEGMGCTLSTLLFRGNEAALCHVGDSRGYLLRDGELQQITKDDTFVQSLVDEGKLAPEDVSSHPQRSLILKALTGRPVNPTLTTFQVKPGDRFMLCSDGLSDPVSFDTIQEALSDGTPDQSSRRLVELALRSGGPDNVTVVIGDVVELDAESNQAVDPSVKLPASPIVAGAVAGRMEESERPNTAASRAAALNLQTTNRPAQTASVERSGGAPGASVVVGGAPADDRHPRTAEQPAVSDEEVDHAAGEGEAASGKGSGKGSGKAKRGRRKDKHSGRHSGNVANAIGAVGGSAAAGHAAAGSSVKHGGGETGASDGKKSKKGLIIGLVIVLVIVAALAAAGYFLVQKTKSSYYVSEQDGVISIYSGKRDSILGQTFNEQYQEICLSESNKITTFTAGTDAPKVDNKDCHLFNVEDLTPVARGAISNLPDGTYDEAMAQVRRLASQTLPVCVTRTSNTNNPEDLTTPGVSCREVE